MYLKDELVLNFEQIIKFIDPQNLTVLQTLQNWFRILSLLYENAYKIIDCPANQNQIRLGYVLSLCKNLPFCIELLNSLSFDLSSGFIFIQSQSSPSPPRLQFCIYLTESYVD